MRYLVYHPLEAENYDEAKAYALQHVMVSQLKRPGPMDEVFRASMEAGRLKAGHGSRRWRDGLVKRDANGILK